MVELNYQMKAIFVLLFSSNAMAMTLAPPPPVSSIVFTIVFGAISVLQLIWIIKLKRRKIDLAPLSIEKQSTMPEGVAASNINVSDNNRFNLLREIRQDEVLAWAYETSAPVVFSVKFLLGFALFLSVGALAVALSFSFMMNGFTDVIYLSLYVPVFTVVGLFDLCAFIVNRNRPDTSIYAVTNKRVFIFSSVNNGDGCCGGRVEQVRSYDLDGIHETTLTRKDDGSGTLTFSTNGAVEGVNQHNPHYNYSDFAFTNIPNVTAVMDLIEQYKTLRKKQAGNQ